MKKIIVALLIVVVVFTACDSVKTGTGKITEGKISYKIDFTGSEMGMLEKQLLQMAKLSISFKDAFMKTEFDMGMMATTVIVDDNTKSGLMLISAMGNKTAARMSSVDLSKNEKNQGIYTVEYSDDAKEIVGYNCKKATLKFDNGSNLTLYYTEDIQPARVNTEFTFSEIKGFPLEMQMDMGGMKFNMVASSVDATPFPADFFNLNIPEGYTETDMAQLNSSMGGGIN